MTAMTIHRQTIQSLLKVVNCVWYIRDTNLKANHNFVVVGYCRNSIRYDLFILLFIVRANSSIFHCVGSAIYVYQSGIGYFADLRLLRLTPFLWNPRQCATRKPYFVRHLLLFLSIISCKPDNAQKNKSHSFEWLSCCALRSWFRRDSNPRPTA